MKRVLITGLAACAAFTAGPALSADATVIASGLTVYDSTVSPLPPNQRSLGFQATQTAEFGDEIALAGTNRSLRTATVTFSTWATRSDWPDVGDAAGWTWPVTLNVYAGSTTSGAGVGARLGSVTSEVTVPWRPEDTAGCPDGKWSPGGDSGTDCYYGKAFNAAFDLSSVGTVPDDVIVTVAFNTQTWGAEPVGVAGPYNSLNVALRDTGVDGPVTVGTDRDPDGVFWNTSTAGQYDDGGVGGVGVLRRDTHWAPLTPAITVTAAASAGGCEFSESGHTLTLLGDCTTDETIAIPAGYAFDGAGHTITAVDPPGGHFTGAVLTNSGTTSAVDIRNVTVTSAGLTDTCDDGADRLRGILLDGVGGTISGVTVTGVRQGSSGCQEGNAIEVRNISGSSAATPAVRVTVTDSTVADYQKNGITLNGGVSGTVTGNTVSGDGPADYTAQNGVQVGFGANATVSGNVITGNDYTGEDVACGLLMYEAAGVRQSRNTFLGNEKNLCNVGRGGGHPSAG